MYKKLMVVVVVMCVLIFGVYMFANDTLKTSLRSLLEILYFLCSAIIALSAVIALSQLRIAKNDICIRSKRETVTSTAIQCDKFANLIIPLNARVMKQMEEAGIPRYDKGIGDFTMSKEAADYLNKWNKKLVETSIGNSITEVLNHLESFSIFFVHGVCDEQISYYPTAKTFTSIISDYYPIILAFKHTHKDFYSNLQKLYIIWSNRLKEEEIKNEYSKMVKKLNRMQEEVAATKTERITPIGLEGE